MTIHILQRGCDSCRHDRTRYDAGDRHTPPESEPGCAVIDDGEPAPKAEALHRYARSGTYWHIVEHGGCPSWQPWRECKDHGLPVHPATGDCSECEAECVRAEDAAQEEWDRARCARMVVTLNARSPYCKDC
jgi:hypothetical protein